MKEKEFYNGETWEEFEKRKLERGRKIGGFKDSNGNKIEYSKNAFIISIVVTIIAGAILSYFVQSIYAADAYDSYIFHTILLGFFPALFLISGLIFKSLNVPDWPWCATVVASPFMLFILLPTVTEIEPFYETSTICIAIIFSIIIFEYKLFRLGQKNAKPSFVQEPISASTFENNEEYTSWEEFEKQKFSNYNVKKESKSYTNENQKEFKTSNSTLINESQQNSDASEEEPHISDPKCTSCKEFDSDYYVENTASDSNDAPNYKTSSARVPLKVGAVLLGCFTYGLIVTGLKSLGIAPGALLAIVIAAPCMWLMRFLSSNAGSKYSPTNYVVANPDKGNFDKNLHSEDYNINYNTSSTVQVKKTKTSAIASSFKLSFKGIVGKICGSIFVSVLSWVSYFTAMEFYIRSYVRGVVDVRANYYDWSISKIHERYDGLIFTIKTGASENPLDSTIFDECYLAVVCGITVLCVAFIVFSIVHNNRRRDKM
jgi:hypothetical protein